MRRLVSLCALLALGVVGCGKTGNNSADTPPDTTPDVTPAGGSTGSGGSGGSGPLKPGEMPEVDCTAPGPSPGATPLSALDNFELNRSVRALMGDTSPSDASLWLVEAPQYGNPFSQLVQAVDPKPIHALAHDLALQLSRDPTATQAYSGCDRQASGDQACARSFIEEFVSRAYRRPLSKEDREDMEAVFAEGQRLAGAFEGGVRAVVEVALQSPEFLYLVEAGGGGTTEKVTELTGSETAARLAYFLTGSPPDAELAAVAAKGKLSADTLEDQARRLLGSPANRELVRHFYDGMLRLRLGTTNDELGYTAPIAALAQEESARFVEDVTFDGAGTFRALLTEPSTWLNAPLAQFYGVPGVVGADFRKVALDPGKRGGILTQAAFLRAHAHRRHTSPVHRGLAVLRALLCVQVPPPPPDISLEPLPTDPSPATTRERLTVATQGLNCGSSCHDDINPPGFAFEHYDAVGKWQDTDNGIAIDSSGVLAKTDAAGPFADAIELLQRIAESDDAKACFAGHWLAQAYRRPAEPGDACALERVSQALAESDGNLVELMVAVATSDNLRYRLKSELTP
jgi:hypothetical protein